MTRHEEMSFEQLIRRAPPLTVSRLVQVLGAAHWSWKVRGFAEDRGGIMIVGPPGSLKSTIVSQLERQYAGVKMMTDINVQGLVKMRESIASGRYHTLVFPEMEKLYERGESTARNIDGTIRALTAEGFMAASFQSQRVNQIPARALVVGAMTTDMVSEHMDHWEATGFNRRFLWVTIKFDQDRLEKAVIDWKPMPIAIRKPMAPNGKISMPVSQDLGRKALVLCRHQPGSGNVLQAAMLRRIFAVLVAQYSRFGNPNKEAWRTLLAFARSLSRTGTEITV